MSTNVEEDKKSFWKDLFVGLLWLMLPVALIYFLFFM